MIFSVGSRLSGSAERLVLQIRDFSRRFSERNAFFGGPDNYQFTGTGLSWSLGDTVAVRIIDPTRITDVQVMSTPRAATDTYGAGETIEIWVTFSDAVNATANTDLVLSVSGRKRAALLRGSGTKTLVFGYTVQAGDEDDNGIYVGDGDDTLVGDRGGNPQSGTITLVANGDEVDLTHDEVGRLSGHKVDGSLTPPANEAPVITTASPVAVAENETAVATLAATDADDDPITWSKTGGADAGRFALTDAGVLTFEAAPDYESPADVASADPANDASNNEYVVFVTARDGADFTELELVVQVTNANEATGTVTIDNTTPIIDDELTATAADVADPDGGLPEPFAPAWQWYRTPAAGAETAIAAATSRTYTVVRADVGAALTAKASWTDGDGFENTLASPPTTAVTRKLPVIVPNGVSITSSAPGDDAEYVTGDVIRVTVTFDEAVAVDETSGTPSLALTVGSNSRPAAYSATHSTATELVFAYAVTVDDQDRDGIAIVADALELNGGAIHKQGEASAAAVLDHAALSTQSSHQVNLPTVISSGGVAVISRPGAASDTYGAGETIEIEVAFSRPVTATAATDFVLSVGGRKRAPLLRGNGTATLVFGYTVQDTDQDGDGIWIGDQARTLVGNRNGDPQTGTITSVATGREADLTHGSLGTQGGHQVDGDLVPRVTIAADQTEFTAELDDVTFTLTRTATVGALTVSVALSQDRDFLESPVPAQTATFQAGESHATLRIGHFRFNDHPVTEHGTLTATVQGGTGYAPGSADSASTRILVVPVAVTLRLEQGSYTFDEHATGAASTVAVIATTAAGIPLPNRTVRASLTLVAIPGQARGSGVDFQNLFATLEFQPSDFSFSAADSVFTARTEVQVELVDDARDEPDETLSVQLSELTSRVVVVRQHDGSVCDGFFCAVTATILDNDEPVPQTEHWSATLRRGDGVDGDSGNHGYVAATETGPGGTLVPSIFTYGDVEYTVDRLYVSRRTDFVTFETSPALPDDAYLVLRLPTFNAAVSGDCSVIAGTQDFDLDARSSAVAPARFGWRPLGCMSAANWAADLTTTGAVTLFGPAPRATPALSVAAAEADEGDPVTFTVTLSDAATEEVTATWTASIESGDTAVAADDLGSTTGTLTIDAGDKTGTFTVATREDTADEEDETFTVTLSSPSPNAELAADATTAQGKIIDDDDPPVIGAAPAAAIEGDPVTFTVTLTPESGKQVTVFWTVGSYGPHGDRATPGSDYTDDAQTLTFAPGDTTKTVTVTTIDDALDEDAETFTLSLIGPTNATFEGEEPAWPAAGTITDNDEQPTLTVREVAAEEGEDLTFTVELSAESGRDVTVSWEAATLDAEGDDAEEGTDYTPASGTLTFTGESPVHDEEGVLLSVTAGETEKTFTVATNEDTTDEDDETFTVTLSSPENAELATDPTAEGRIVDDDAPPSLSVDDATAPEGRDVNFPVRLSAASGRQVTATWTASVETDDTAVAADFTGLSAATGTLTFTAGQTERTVAVSTAEDTTHEPDETFTVTLSSASNASIADATATGTIENDDLPVVTIAADDTNVNEDRGPADFTLSRTGSTTAALTVTVAVTQQADRDLLPDGAAAERTVTFAVNSAAATLAVALENDNLAELTGRLTVEVRAGEGYAVGDPATATVSVLDLDRGVPTPANLTAEAGAGVGEVVLAWDRPAPQYLIRGHEYRYKTDGAYPDEWTEIPTSGQGFVEGEGANLAGWTVTGLVGGQAHTFQVRTVRRNNVGDLQASSAASARVWKP